ncbi:thioredoxin domain-containing protein [bacterium]|nr:MAG: thioredoxin domain-containing protein [bacterium]
MRRPNYSAVTGVTTALVAVCVFRLIFQPQIPPPHPELAQGINGEFVARAASQDVAWYPLGPRAFADAQRLSRPILIAIGVPWSGVGREADRSFVVPEIATALNRGFIPVRIDAAHDPRWISEFLPLQRARTGFSVGFQGWVFDLKGRLIDFVGRIDAGETLNQQRMLTALVRAQDRFSKAVLEDSLPPLEASQLADAAALQDPAMSDLSIAKAARSLSDSLDPRLGGWNVHGIEIGRPLAYRFLQVTGEARRAGIALRSLALSPQCDWLDGGFFRLIRTENRQPDYDKVCAINAQFAEALAVQDAISSDPLLRKAAKRTVEWLLSTRSDGMLPGAEQGDEDLRGRSERSSFAPRRLRQAVSQGLISAAQKSWAESNLGLNGSGGGERLAYPNDPRLVGDVDLDQTLTALRKAAGRPRARVAPNLADTNGAVAACLLRIARLWNDETLATQAGEIVDAVDHFQSRGRVRHSLRQSWEDGYLSDSLAYADATLEDFLTNGRVPSLQRGAETLRTALRIFGDGTGTLRTSAKPLPLVPPRLALPQVTDDEHESTSAASLRILDAYAAVLGSSGEDFHQAADRLYARIGAVSEALPSMGGALGSLARHLDSRAVLVVGQDAAARAFRLARKLPNRLVAPILGPARPDLVGKPAGIYIATPTSLTGPFTEEEVLRRLPINLEVGL